jgi:hypothetical protein
LKLLMFLFHDDNASRWCDTRYDFGETNPFPELDAIRCWFEAPLIFRASGVRTR